MNFQGRQNTQEHFVALNPEMLVTPIRMHYSWAGMLGYLPFINEGT